MANDGTDLVYEELADYTDLNLGDEQVASNECYDDEEEE